MTPSSPKARRFSIITQILQTNDNREGVRGKARSGAVGLTSGWASLVKGSMSIVQGTPKTKNSSDLTHCFLGGDQIHILK